MKVQQLIDEAAAETPNQDTTMQVLVRVKVDHSGFPVLGNQRFGSQFVGKVANPSDILLFSRDKKGATDDDASSAACLLKNPIRPGAPPPPSSMLCVEQLLSNHLAGSDKVLEILPETNLAHALDDFVFKNIPTAFGDIYDTVLEESQGALKKNKATLNKHDIQSLVEKNLERIKASQAVHVGQSAMDTHEVLRMLQTTTTTQRGDGEHDNDLDGLSDDDGYTPITTSAAKHGRGRSGGAAASVKATTSTPARKAAKQPKHANKKQSKSTHRFSDSDDQPTYGDDNDNDDHVVVVMSSSGSDFDEPPLRQTARKPAAASKRPPAATKRKAATRRTSDALPPSSSTRKKQKTISALFSQSATPLPPATATTTTTYGASSWRDGGTQATTQGTSTTQRRKLPLSFSSYTQDDDADVRSSALPPSSANAWGRAKK
ncbi:hypothetical protein DYB36_012727 [Aphanomyces astaci]|uniref:Mre11 DNA-binding domain-containing protein n=1 Tax=Aphanomyces astaci TaxID=112090 RepID=A0A397BW47_APHAT|nr:hypothetical protein DYB36_012727 [Aphanomyces astaci]